MTEREKRILQVVMNDMLEVTCEFAEDHNMPYTEARELIKIACFESIRYELESIDSEINTMSQILE
jgi:hypothetical protein